MGLIYMRTSPSGGIYIGKTITTEQERWSEHIYEALESSNSNYNTILSKAIRKYGADNFKLTILEECKDNNYLLEREQYWIQYYSSFYKDNSNGYNMTRGGEGHTIYTYKDFLLLWNQGWTVRDIATEKQVTIKTVSDALKNYGITQQEIYNRGNQIGLYKRLNNNNRNVDDIYKLWQEGKSIKEICIILNLMTSPAHILKKYFNVSQKEIYDRCGQSNSKNRSIPIIQYDLNNNFIREWKSASQVHDELGYDISSIRKVCNGKKLQYKNYIWKNKELTKSEN